MEAWRSWDQATARQMRREKVLGYRDWRSHLSLLQGAENACDCFDVAGSPRRLGIPMQVLAVQCQGKHAKSKRRDLPVVMSRRCWLAERDCPRYEKLRASRRSTARLKRLFAIGFKTLTEGRARMRTRRVDCSSPNLERARSRRAQHGRQSPCWIELAPEQGPAAESTLGRR